MNLHGMWTTMCPDLHGNRWASWERADILSMCQNLGFRQVQTSPTGLAGAVEARWWEEMGLKEKSQKEDTSQGGPDDRDLGPETGENRCLRGSLRLFVLPRPHVVLVHPGMEKAGV